MAQKKDSPATDVSQRDITALSKKLDQWGSTLPESERSLLQLMVSHTRFVDVEAVRTAQIRERLSVAVAGVFRGLPQGATPEGWAKIGPIWYKKNQFKPGEEVEITARVQLGKR
jgi:hypothetical protein